MQFFRHDPMAIEIISVRIESDKEISIILNHLGALAEMAAVLDAQWMELKSALQPGQLGLRRSNQVNPQQTALLSHQFLGIVAPFRGCSGFQLDPRRWHQNSSVLFPASIRETLTRATSSRGANGLTM